MKTRIFGFICVCLLLSGCINEECYRSFCKDLGYTGEVHGLGKAHSAMKYCMDKNGRGYPVFLKQCQ